MIFWPARTGRNLRATCVIWMLAAGWLAAEPAGPTLHFDFGNGRAQANPLAKFMYFVPLISPEPVTVFTNAGNRQCARVTSYRCRTNGLDLHTVCEFEFTGEGVERNVFDKSAQIAEHESAIKAGKPMVHQLAGITVQGSGSGSVEIESRLTNGTSVVSEVRLRFNRQGRASPVTISLEDLGWSNNAIQPENEMVARVDTLAIRSEPGTPQMEVTLDSVKAKDAGDSVWQNFIGGIKGAAVNMFLPPLRITAEGRQAMLDFGLALATGKTEFTFPIATRRKAAPAFGR